MSVANDLALHLAKYASVNPQLAYLIGPGSETWKLITHAIADITGESSDAVDCRLSKGLKTTPIRPDPVEGPRDAADDLRQGVSRTAHETLDLIERDKLCWDQCYSAFELIQSGHGYASTANKSQRPESKRAIAIEAAARLIHGAERLAQ